MSCATGVEVGSWKNAEEGGKFNCIAGGVIYVNAALKNASIMLIASKMVDRKSFFFILWQVYHAGI
jgi:hypothetical protein